MFNLSILLPFTSYLYFTKRYYLATKLSINYFLIAFIKQQVPFLKLIFIIEN
jgi:hypothetical protein